MQALMDRVRSLLNPEDFQAFRRKSGAFMHGDITAEDYHRDVVDLGLANLAPQMAALLPDEAKRSTLLAAHRAFFSSDNSSGAHSGSASTGRWVPPEAAAAAAAQFEARGLWTCPQCTLLNAPSAVQCEACSHVRPHHAEEQQDEEVHQAKQASVEKTNDVPRPEDGKPAPSAKPRKIPKFERLRLTGGDAVATQAWLDTSGGTKPAVKPQNVWTQRRSAAVGGAGPELEPGALRGQWAKAGR